MNGITASQLAAIMDSSLESRIDVAETLASEAYGKPVSLFATKDGEWHGVSEDDDGDGNIVRFTVSEGKIEHEVLALGEDDSSGAVVHEMLTDGVDAIFEGDARNHLRGLTRVLSDDGVYWLSEAIDRVGAIMGESASGWWGVYEENRKGIRKTLHGRLGQIEQSVPTTRYAKLPESKLVDFLPELRESVLALIEKAGGIVDEATSMVFDADEAHGVDLGALRDSLMGNAEKLKTMLSKMAALAKDEDVVATANTHDRVAEFLKPMTVTSRFLAGQATQE